MSLLSKINEFLFGEEQRHPTAEEHLKRGIAKIAINDFKGALRNFTQAIEESAECAEAYYNRALVYEYLNERDKAIEDMLTARRLFAELNNDRFLALANGKLREMGMATGL